jgi:hypothetical protein
MNDNDWKGCSALDAHKEYVGAGCEVQEKYRDNSWYTNNSGCFCTSKDWKYRIRKKQEYISIKIPKPTTIFWHSCRSSMQLYFSTKEESQKCRDEIVKAIQALKTTTV